MGGTAGSSRGRWKNHPPEIIADGECRGGKSGVDDFERMDRLGERWAFGGLVRTHNVLRKCLWEVFFSARIDDGGTEVDKQQD